MCPAPSVASTETWGMSIDEFVDEQELQFRPKSRGYAYTLEVTGEKSALVTCQHNGKEIGRMQIEDAANGGAVLDVPGESSCTFGLPRLDLDPIQLVLLSSGRRVSNDPLQRNSNPGLRP